MKYYRIEFLDDAATHGFMEIDEYGVCVRLTSLDGETLKNIPHHSYRTLDLEPVDSPAWGT
jgi:hypothetical protein